VEASVTLVALMEPLEIHDHLVPGSTKAVDRLDDGTGRKVHATAGASR
jgi:hypothetical protein